MKNNLKSKEKLYRRWINIKRRCCNKNDSAFEDYGGRGILICNEWIHNYSAFKEWSLNNGYNPNLTIDRIDNNDGYSPSNCRWATVKEQQNNTRKNINVIYNNKTYTVAELCDKLNLRRGTIYERLRDGWSVEKVFEIPIRVRIKSRRGKAI